MNRLSVVKAQHCIQSCQHFLSIVSFSRVCVLTRQGESGDGEAVLTF